MASDNEHCCNDVILVTGACRGVGLADIALVAINLDWRGDFISFRFFRCKSGYHYFTYKEEHVKKKQLASSFLSLLTKTPDGKMRKWLLYYIHIYIYKYRDMHTTA